MAKKDHVWSLTAGSLYILGVKKDVKRAEQMEGEKKRERGRMGRWGSAGKEGTIQQGEV